MALFRALFCCLLAFHLQAQEVTNGGFEAGVSGWRFWSRTAKAGSIETTGENTHAGKLSGWLRHDSDQDWSLQPIGTIPVQAGEIYEFEAWVRLETEGSITLCVSIWDEKDQNLDWSYGERTVIGPGPWQLVKTRFVVPPGVAHFQPRLIGSGPMRARLDDFELRKAQGSLWPVRSLPESLAVSNQSLLVVLDTASGAFSVTDLRTKRVWKQQVMAPAIAVVDAKARGQAIELKLFHVSTGLELTARLALEPAVPELNFHLEGNGDMDSAVKFPHPFTSASGESLVIPLNEGISYPVDDPAIPLERLIAYGGHGICMGFWGVTDGQSGHMAIIQTADDAAIQTARADGRMLVAPHWDPQRGRFGYARKLRYVFFDRGGHVAMAKRYRKYAIEAGFFKTLAQKRQENPNVDLLIGAVNVWCWDKDAVGLTREMQAAGIDRILWSNAQPPDHLRALNELGVLTSRYDIYQDVMNPAEFSRLRYTHQDWPTAAWQNDIILDWRGQWIKGWGIETRDGGSMVYCGVVCDKPALAYARQRVPEELKTHDYKCRFIDTTTASPWRECYNTNHPMTRTESKQAKMQLLRYLCEDARLVTGSETGHDAAVPYVHYFEGMLSLGPYRVPDAGRNMSRIYTNVPPLVMKYQVGHQYRLPLWELVFHDCVVAQWYWGDYNNKLPEIWTRRDLFNVLYGTPPMFMFDRKLWNSNKDRFVQSYKNTCPQVRKTGYSEMVDHRFLTPDRSVQQTVFQNGQTVTVNFGGQPFEIPGGPTLKALSFNVTEER